jgi:polysaccharide pyruvyl transferase WcaK-like protein
VKPNPERIAINAKFAEADHARQREAITTWVRKTRLRVFLVPEMTYQVSRLRPLLFDPLPADVKPHVAVMDRYWLTAEAASVYARAAAVLSFELHSPIMAIAAGVPAIHLRQPTDTSKGQMWRDVGLGDWLFEIEGATGEQIAVRLLALHHNRQATEATVAKARAFTDARARAMMDAITEAAVTGGAVDR